jgi:predicted RNase H-like HicB family nuclease
LKYLIVIEKAKNNYSAYLPDVPGCIATGGTIEEAKKNITEAPAIHLHGLVEDGFLSPEAKATAGYIAVS